MYCKICGKKSGKTNVCSKCNYFLKQGSDEETLKAMYSDDNAKKVWEENKQLADDLADAYYDSLLDSYGKSWIKKADKKVLGFNTFADGIRVGLDTIMPMLDEDMQEKIKQKIVTMLINASIRMERMKLARKKVSNNQRHS